MRVIKKLLVTIVQLGSEIANRDAALSKTEQKANDEAKRVCFVLNLKLSNFANYSSGENWTLYDCNFKKFDGSVT